MAAITICSDFGAQKWKLATVSTVSPSICHEVMGPDAMILVFWMLRFKPTFSLSSFAFFKRLFAKLLQSCPILCDPMDCSLPGSSIHGIFHARVLEWAAIAFSKRLFAAAAAAKSLQSCPTLCDPMDCSLPGFSVHGILQARTLEWVAISFSNAWKWKVKVKSFSRIWLLATPWTAAYQAPPSMWFSRQQYWSGVPLPSPKRLFSSS